MLSRSPGDIILLKLSVVTGKSLSGVLRGDRDSRHLNLVTIGFKTLSLGVYSTFSLVFPIFDSSHFCLSHPFF